MVVKTTLTLGLLILANMTASAQDLLVEAESFENHGGWKLDTQFIREMGSPLHAGTWTGQGCRRRDHHH